MSRARKKLIPVFISPELYLPNYNIPDELLYQKQKTTVVNTLSIIHPFNGCPYFSFQQLAPADRATNALSWVITPNPGQEVIQFLTGQINYTIRWKLKKVAELTGNEKVTFLLPIITEGKAYEPWDINGNRIKFEIPTRKGCTTKGKFVVPGTYGQFIIESPGYSLVMKMKITGDREQRCPDPWYYSPKNTAYSLCLPSSECDPCSSGCSGNSPCSDNQGCDGVNGGECEKTTFNTNSCRKGKCTPVYINQLVVVNMIRRTILPEFEIYNCVIQAKFRQNPRFPCFDLPVSSGQLQQNVPEFYLFDSRYITGTSMTANPLNIIKGSYRTDVPLSVINECMNDTMISQGPYTKPVLIDPASAISLIIPSGSADSSQFQLAQIPDGSFYRISFRIHVESMSWNELDPTAKHDALGNRVTEPVRVPGYFCDETDSMRAAEHAGKYLTFTMYNVSGSELLPVPAVGDTVYPPGQIGTDIAITLPYPTVVPGGDQFTSYLTSELNMWSTEQGLTYYYDMLTQDQISSNVYAFRVNNLIWNYPGIIGIPPNQLPAVAYGGGARIVSINVNIRVMSAV